MARFEPNQQALLQLRGLGLTDNAAIRGLLRTGNVDADRAAEWCFEHLDDPALDLPLSADEISAVISASQLATLANVQPMQPDHRIPRDDQTPVKLVFIVNSSLSMGTGKVASQVSHAMVDILLTLREVGHDISDSWLSKKRKAIVLKARDDEQLRGVVEKARQARLVISQMRDAGLTQVAPGSLTVVGLYGEETQFEPVLQDLPPL